jgi:HB1, ASXL, restriction endonuclease HTH domain
MPDRHGFNHLGDHVRCIDCPTGGPLGKWPEHKRARHARSHGHNGTSGARDLRRQRPLLTAPPTNSNEEKEATMPTTNTQKGASARQVAIDILRTAGEPLHASEIAKRVIASGRCAGLKGKTPEATISAMLAVGSKPGGPFARVDKGTYALAEAPAAPTSAKTGKPAAKRAPARKTAARSKTKSTTRTRGAAKRTR